MIGKVSLSEALWRARAGQARRVASTLSPTDAALVEAYARNAKTAPALPLSKAPVSITVDQSRLTVETIGPLGRQPEVVCQIKPLNLALRRQRSHVRIVSGASSYQLLSLSVRM